MRLGGHIAENRHTQVHVYPFCRFYFVEILKTDSSRKYLVEKEDLAQLNSVKLGQLYVCTTIIKYNIY